MKWLINLFISIDQLFNALLNGSPDETLSSRAYRADRDKKVFGKVFRPLIDLIFFWQKRHCYQSYLAEVERKQLSGSFK